MLNEVKSRPAGRKLKLQMQMTLDGFVSTGPNDDQTWVTWAWDEIKHDVLKIIDTTDTIILGRKLAVDYIPYWLDVVTKPDDPMYELAYRIAGSKKIIFTKTLKEAKWDNTGLAEGDLSEEIKRLKSQSGKDIIVYGGTLFVASLVKENLIDEYYLFVNPVALGKGASVFDQLKNIRQMKLKNSIAYPSGIVLLNYSVH